MTFVWLIKEYFWTSWGRLVAFCSHTKNKCIPFFFAFQKPSNHWDQLVMFLKLEFPKSPINQRMKQRKARYYCGHGGVPKEVLWAQQVKIQRPSYLVSGSALFFRFLLISLERFLGRWCWCRRSQQSLGLYQKIRWTGPLGTHSKRRRRKWARSILVCQIFGRYGRCSARNSKKGSP